MYWKGISFLCWFSVRESLKSSWSFLTVEWWRKRPIWLVWTSLQKLAMTFGKNKLVSLASHTDKLDGFPSIHLNGLLFMQYVPQSILHLPPKETVFLRISGLVRTCGLWCIWTQRLAPKAGPIIPARSSFQRIPLIRREQVLIEFANYPKNDWQITKIL